MKRILMALVVFASILHPVDSAHAKPRKKSHAAPALEMENKSDKDADRPVRVTARIKREKKQAGPPDVPPGQARKGVKVGPPVERKLNKAHGKVFDLRSLPHTRPVPRERPELEGPEPNPVQIEAHDTAANPNVSVMAFQPQTAAAAPPPIITFDGLDRFNWGAGSPPDTNGDVGPNHYIQTVNSSIGVYDKSGSQLAAFTFDTFMSQGNFGNLCDTNNFGDPVVLYDTFEDRWIITDFAFQVDGGGNPITPAYQCIAASMTGDPVAGGWNFYSIQVADALNDYPKLGIWPDGLYMSSNLFSFGAGAFQAVRVWAFNKAQMYAGSPTVKIVSFDIGGGDFAAMPSNARLQTGTPPPGRPNLFVSTWLFTNAMTVYKFHVDWNQLSLSTFTGPDTPIAPTSWPNAAVANAPQPGTATLLDVLQIRAMVQNQYTNFGGAESLWLPHTVRRGNTSGFAAPRWYQVNVTGGNVAPSTVQATTWDPDGANVVHRFMPSLAVDRAGNMALGYSTSNATTGFPSINYAGRLATDPVNTFSQTEQVLFTGTASQTTTSRWGDYSSMTLDPDGCTFWYTTEYANPASQATNQRWLTKIGAFRYPQCTAVGAGGTISGTVTAVVGGAPIVGATVQLGARTATTNGSGIYSFSVPAGMYPSMDASKPGFNSVSASSLLVTDGNTTTQNFALTSAPASACLTDTTQGDYLAGVATNVDLNTTPGDITLSDAPIVDQSNAAGTTTGTGFGTPAFTGQTFIAGLTGQLVQADIQLFCNGCGATPPNLTLSVRNTAAGLPTGADLATATVPGSAFASGATTSFTASFGSPVALTAGTQYALILRPVSVPAGSGYFWIRSSPSTYANGSRVLSGDSGGTWSADTTRDYNYKTYIRTGYTPSGTFVSSPRDSNPAGGLTSIWSTFSWNGSVPANTTLQFQFAGSNNVNGPFNFVGPDGTAGTFFTTSPVQLSPQFYNFRYLEYKAFLATTNGTVTPVLNDATACVNDVDCSSTQATITPNPPAVCANSAGNTASGPAGMTSYAWGIANGTITSATNTQTITYTAGASGTATLTLTVTAPNGCIVSNSAPVTINPIPPKPVISGTLSYCIGFSTTLSSDSASGNQWYLGGNPIGGATGQQFIANVPGSYTVTVSDGNSCVSPMSDPAVVIENTPPPTPTISATTNGTGTQDQACPEQPLTLTANGATGAVSYQWYQDNNTLNGETAATYQATGVGTYYVTATDANGCTTVQSAGYVVQNPTPHSPFITPAGPTTFCVGGSVTLQSDSATGIQWWKDGGPIAGAGSQNYVATTSGTYTAQLNALGCHSQFGQNIVVTVNPLPATPTVTPGGPTTFCAGGSVTLTSSAATGDQWYLNGNPIGGEINQQYIATASGNYTVVETDGNGCPSAPSAAVSVTVNPLPPTPTITPGGPTTFCVGGSVTLTSSSASGNQWYLNGNPIGGATNTTYVATASGDYTVTSTVSGCSSAASAATTVTVNPIPATPTTTPGGPTTFCTGGSVTLTSSAASGNQWYLNGNPIGGATNTTYVATASGDYTVTSAVSGCSGAASAATTVTVNPIPATPTITPGGPTTFCVGGSVTLTSSSASGNQWYLNGNPIGGGTNQSYVATASGSYTVVSTASGCSSAASAATTVTVNPIPATPAITPGGPTTFCAGGSVTLTSSAAAGNQWYLNGNPIGGATATQYVATASGDYTVNSTASGCSSAASAATTVTMNPTPATPATTPGGPTTFCTGGSVVLTSSAATGNQWSLNGNPIGGATNQTYTASVAGDYTVTTTATGCSSAASAATTVTVNPLPNATITVPGSVVSGSTGNSASVANAGAGATYNWSITNGTITGGTGTPGITFTAGAVGSLTLQLTVTTSGGCPDTKSANATVTAAPPAVTVTSVTPGRGSYRGGNPVTITGSGFLAGATVLFDTTAATSVVVVNSTTITAMTPAHVSATVDVTVTNTDATTATLSGAFVYGAQFDPNGDGVVDPADIFYLVNYLFTGGPAPRGLAGMMSGDSNDDNTIDPSDIFYAVSYLFTAGPAPASVRPVTDQSFRAALSLGTPVLRDGKYFVPVVLTPASSSMTPQSVSLRLKFSADIDNAAIVRDGAARALQPVFEISRQSHDTLSYLVSFDPAHPLTASGKGLVIATLSFDAPPDAMKIAFDPSVTLVSNDKGTIKATSAGGSLALRGIAIGVPRDAKPQTPSASEVQQ